MHLPKAIEILQSFSSADWRECGDFLKGRMRADHDCILLYDQIKKKKGKLSRYDEYQSIIKADHFAHITSKSFTNLHAKLVKVIEEYLAFDQLIHDPIASQLSVLRSLNSRGLYKLFDQKADSLEKELLGKSRIDIHDELHLMELNHMRFFSDNPIKDTMGITLLNDVRESANQFNSNYNLFIDSVELHFKEIGGDIQNGIRNKKQKSQIKAHLEKLKSFKQKKAPFLFKDLTKSLRANDIFMSEELKAVTIQCLIHYGHDNLKSGDLQLIEPLLDLYEYGLKSGALLTNKGLTETRFLNLIIFFSANKRYKRAQLVIENYSHILSSWDRDGTSLMALAYLDFYQERYEEVIEALRDFPFQSSTLNTRRRWMLICSYYKTTSKNGEFFSHQLKNYNSYFYNNRSKVSKTVYEGSINLSKVILLLQNQETKESIELFVNECKILFHRAWVKKEVETLQISTS